MTTQPIALTQTVQKGGCAAKIAAAELRKILTQVKFPKSHPNLLVDGGLFDDAAIYKVTDEIALVQTLDFFTPILNSPYHFGAVAAANALSDVYAMGGRPKTAMGILAFPIATLPENVIVEMLQAASDKIAEANANFVGGHSIDDDTLKFGLSVTGFVHPDRIWTNAGAKIGDHLILTKPLGTGTMTAALKRNELNENDIEEAIHSMAKLNNIIDLLDENDLQNIHAATDITGFGLSGHSMQLARASNLSLHINVKELPVFEKTFSCLENKFLTKAHRSNSEYTEKTCEFSKLSALEQLLIHDPQTSGGLFLSISANSSQKILEKIKKQFPKAAIIGTVLAKQNSQVLYE